MNLAGRPAALARWRVEGSLVSEEAGKKDKETAVMTESLRQILRRIIRFLLFAAIVGILGQQRPWAAEHNYWQ